MSHFDLLWPETEGDWALREPYEALTTALPERWSKWISHLPHDHAGACLVFRRWHDKLVDERKPYDLINHQKCSCPLEVRHWLLDDIAVLVDVLPISGQEANQFANTMSVTTLRSEKLRNLGNVDGLKS